MMRVEQGILRLLSGVLTIGVLTSCTASSEVDPTIPPTSVDGSSDADTTAGSAGELAVASGTEPQSMDVHLVQDNTRSEVIERSVTEALTQNTAEGLQPLLAESWEQVGNGFEFRLREGVTFHDGSELNADVVVANYERLLDPGNTSELIGQVIDEDYEVTKLDEMSIRIETPEPKASILASTTQIPIMAEAWLTGNSQQSTLVGTGPYTLEEWQPARQMRLEAFADYWGEPASIDAVTISFLSEEAARLSALQAGEIDLALAMSPDNQVQAPKALFVPASQTHLMVLNTKDGPFSDVRIREAASLAIDRDLLLSELLGEAAAPSFGLPVANYVFGATDVNGDPMIDEPTYDPERARELLEEADAVGVQVVINATNGRWPLDADMARAVAGMWNEVGLKAVVEIPGYSEWLDWQRRGVADPSEAPDATSSAHGNDTLDVENTVGTWLACDSPWGMWCNEEFTRLAMEANTTLDRAERLAVIEDMWSHYEADVPIIATAEIFVSMFTSEGVVLVETPVEPRLRFQHFALESS